jgi:hypothetical protein
MERQMLLRAKREAQNDQIQRGMAIGNVMGVASIFRIFA